MTSVSSGGHSSSYWCQQRQLAASCRAWALRHRRKPLPDGFDIDHHHHIWYRNMVVNPYLTLSKVDSIICGRALTRASTEVRGGVAMAVSVEWEIKGTEFANCNCAYGCVCQFNALPDKGFCEAVAGYQIQQGNFGDVRLDGLRAAAMWRWPGAVHEGNGVMQIVIDERADARQRDALAQILSGQETEDMATVWWVFSAMCPTKHEPLFHPIHFDVDVDARRARLDIPGLVRSVGEPIRNPVTGAEHRVRIDFPQSFEFRLAEIGSGTSKTSGPIALDLTSTYGQFAHIHLSHKGRLN